MSELLHPEETITTVIFVRHGHTKQTEEGKLYSDPEAVLSDAGMKQAKALADFCKGENPELLFSSSASRTRATADIVGKTLAMETLCISGFEEQSVGDWEGRSYLEIKKQDPGLYERWSRDPIRNRPPGGESIEDLLDRISKSMAELLQERAGKKVMIVSHAGVIRSALVLALGMPIDNFYRISVPCASVCKLDYSSNFVTMHYLRALDC